MADVDITHPFVSAKSDSPDDTLVSASEWNDAHVFAGGINGQILLFDNTQPNNAKWVDGPRTHSGSTILGATASPYNSSTIISIVTNTLNSVSFSVLSIVTTSGGAAYTLEIKINSTPAASFSNVASGTSFTFTRSTNLGIGTFDFTVTLTASSGTFTAILIELTAFSIGRN